MPYYGDLTGVVGYKEQSLPIKYAEIYCSASGDNTLVQPVSGKCLRVISLTFTCSANVTVSWKSNSTVLVQPMSFAQYGGMDCNRHPGYFAQTLKGQTLIMNLSGAVDVRGSLNYVEVDE